MKSGFSQASILRYKEPSSAWDEITEGDFRDAIMYMVAIFPPERDYSNTKAHNEALSPFDSEYRRARRTLERYAIEILKSDPKAMRVCHKRYANNPSFFKDGLPRHFVSSVLNVAWANIGMTPCVV